MDAPAPDAINGPSPSPPPPDADTPGAPTDPSPARPATPPPLSSSLLPRLDDSSRWTEPASGAAASPRFGPTSVRETRDYALPVLSQPPPPSEPPRGPSTRRTLSRSSGSETDSTTSYSSSSDWEPSSPSPSIPTTAASSRTNPPTRIPKIPAFSSSVEPQYRPAPPAPAPPATDHARLARGLEGMYVDEFGNVLDWDGRVLGRVAGDLPAMVGRPVTATGEVFGTDGSVAGHVDENDTIEEEEAVPEPTSLASMAGSGLKVDHLGNILDADGRVIGHLNKKTADAAGLEGDRHNSKRSTRESDCPPSSATLEPPSSRPGAPSPSEVYLDVKSTMEGIQIILKIPTVFGEGRQPQIHIT